MKANHDVHGVMYKDSKSNRIAKLIFPYQRKVVLEAEIYLYAYIRSRSDSDKCFDILLVQFSSIYVSLSILSPMKR